MQRRGDRNGHYEERARERLEHDHHTAPGLVTLLAIFLGILAGVAFLALDATAEGKFARYATQWVATPNHQ